jgi:hypothetical protein
VYIADQRSQRSHPGVLNTSQTRREATPDKSCILPQGGLTTHSWFSEPYGTNGV